MHLEECQTDENGGDSVLLSFKLVVFEQPEMVATKCNARCDCQAPGSLEAGADFQILRHFCEGWSLQTNPLIAKMQNLFCYACLFGST